MNTQSLELKKDEIISKRDDINLLFTKSESFKMFPFKVLHRLGEESEGSFLKTGITIPKRLFKKAVDRNLLKRRSKEAYRNHRNELKTTLTESKKEVHIMLIYIAREQLDYTQIEEKIILTLQRLQAIYAENTQ